MSNRPVRVARWIAVRLLRALWVSMMILTPLFGFWVASSLAAYQNATQWLALVVGLLLFPILPVGWDLLFVWRRSKRPPKKAILTRLDRLVLRTLVVDGVFLAITFYALPQTASRALAVRGDWMLDGQSGPIAQGVRGWLLGFADRIERRWHVADERYGTSDTAPDETPHPDAQSGWPLPAEPDILVTSIPASVETSVEAVGHYLAERFPDPKRRVKAVHDYVVLRLSYDYDALERKKARPSQQADDVFVSRLAVCEGYSRLMAALGKAAGLEIAYVTGYARDSMLRVQPTSDAAVIAGLEGYAHAWNAVKLDGLWLLIDATWDDPKDPKSPIESTYLLTPPALFAMQHLPDQASWQLLASPLSPGDFVRQPLVTPTAGRLGVTITEPNRSQVTVDGDLAVIIANPYHATLDAYAVPAGSKDHGSEKRCEVEPSGERVRILCTLGTGQFDVRLFGQPGGSTSTRLDYFGSIQVNSR